MMQYSGPAGNDVFEQLLGGGGGFNPTRAPFMGGEFGAGSKQMTPYEAVQMRRFLLGNMLGEGATRKLNPGEVAALREQQYAFRNASPQDVQGLQVDHVRRRAQMEMMAAMGMGGGGGAPPYLIGG